MTARAGTGLSADADRRLQDLLEERTRANGTFFAAEAERLARLCHATAERFARGGRLVAVGASPAARSDARHVAVEFVHPVIVGKRALPALALTPEGGSPVEAVDLLVRADDIVMAFGADEDRGEAAGAIQLARSRGCLTVAFGDCGAEWDFFVPSTDALVRQELIETLYHVLWELVHVFFEHRGLLSGRTARETHDSGASSFLYPFLAEAESDLPAVLEDVRRSVVMKSEEIGALRVQTLSENAGVIVAGAEMLTASFADGGELLAFGNGGSATDAMDAVADFRSGGGGRRPRPAIDLTEDTGIITAVANDVGVEAIFARQLIAYGAPGDVVIALSTSGNSGNVAAGLAQARRQGLGTIALVGYDGGRVAADGLADVVIVTRSEHIPRIQEAQASALHALRELVG